MPHWLSSVHIVLLLLVIHGQCASSQGSAQLFDQEAVDDLSDKISKYFKDASCKILRTGIGCEEPGLKSELQQLDKEGGYNRTVLNLQRDVCVLLCASLVRLVSSVEISLSVVTVTKVVPMKPAGSGEAGTSQDGTGTITGRLNLAGQTTIRTLQFGTEASARAFDAGCEPQIFKNASQVVTKLRDNMERLIVTRHRIAKLQVTNFSELRESDPTHPRFAEAPSNELEGKIFNKKVIKASTVKYAPHVPYDGRKEMLAANASEGLDEFFVENLNNPNFNFLRWQRFVSHTGLTRQFPGAYDAEQYDNRLTDWYNMAAQAPKRILFLLDLSTSMRDFHRFEIAKQTVITLLETLIPEDLVNVLLVDDRGSTPKCFGGELVPATKERIAYLQNYVRVASVVPADQQLLNTVVKAVSVFEDADDKMAEPERKAYADDDACEERRCIPKLEFIMFISDGWFTLDTANSEVLENLAANRPSLHVHAIAVGDGVQEGNMRRISCAFNGLFFHIPTIGGAGERRSLHPSDDITHESFILNRMSEYFQLVAAPLARNHTTLRREYEGDELNALALDVTWTVPKPDAERSSLLVTIALPCFGDSDSDTPRLLGIVAVDLLFMGPLNVNEVSVFSSFLSASSDDVPRTLVDAAVVFKNQYPAVTFMDSHLLLKYHRLSHRIEDFSVYEPYAYDEHMGRKFQESGVMDRVLNEPGGVQGIRMEQKMSLDINKWRFEPVKSTEIDATVAWKHIEGHPFVLLIIVAWAPDENGYNHFVNLNVYDPANANCVNYTAGTSKRCWDIPSHHIAGASPDYAPGSWLYLPAWAFMDVSKFVHFDALSLPPKCGRADTLPCTASARLRKLMLDLNGELKLEDDDTNVTGGGLTRRARNEVLGSSLINAMWDRTFDETDRRLLRRVYMSTSHGVFRTRAQPELGAPMLPMLYNPIEDSWYLQAIGDQDKIVLSSPLVSLMDSERHLPHVLVVSQMVRHGFVSDDDQDFSQATVAAVIAAELDFSQIHTQLYGENGMAGRGQTTYLRCQESSVRCFVVDQHGLLIMHQDFRQGDTGLNWQAQRLSLGEVEPILMESLVQNGVMVQNVRRHTSLTEREYSYLLTYDVQPDMLPFEQSLYGGTTGHYFVSQINGTTAILIAIADYKSESIYHTGCSILSSQCPSSDYPAVSEASSDPCLDQASVFLYRKAYRMSLLPSFEFDSVIQALRLMHFCPAVKPDWIWHVSIGGGAAVICVFAGLFLKQVLYKRKRQLWVQARLQEDTKAHSKMSIHKQPRLQGTAEEAELKRVQRRVERYFNEAHALHKMENTDIDEVRKMIEVQANLTTTLRSRKFLSQEVDAHHLESLAVDLSTMRLLAGNLKERLSAHEQERAQSSLQFINTDMQKLATQTAELQKNLEDFMLPTVSIPHHTRDTMAVSALSASNGAAPAVDPEEEIQDEVKFYSQFYPHLFRYHEDQALDSVGATGQTSTHLRTIDSEDDTEATAPTITMPTVPTSTAGRIQPFK